MHRLPSLHVGSPTLAGPLTVFPIWTDAPAVRRSYLPLTAWAPSVREHHAGPTIDRLTVANSAPRPLLVLEGTLLTGGWQHRVVAHDVLVAPGASRDLRVACVEQGRWGGEAAQHLGREAAPLAVRAALRGIQRRAGDDGGGPARPSDTQGDVWTRVSGYERRFGSSATGSLVDVHRRMAPRLEEMISEAGPLLGQRGVVVGISGHPVLLEVFDDPQTLTERLPALLVAAALDAFGAPVAPTPGHRARAFARRVEAMNLGATVDEPDAPCVRAGRDDLAATQALMAPGHVFHASALNVRHALVRAA